MSDFFALFVRIFGIFFDPLPLLVRRMRMTPWGGRRGEPRRRLASLSMLVIAQSGRAKDTIVVVVLLVTAAAAGGKVAAISV